MTTQITIYTVTDHDLKRLVEQSFMKGYARAKTYPKRPVNAQFAEAWTEIERDLGPIFRLEKQVEAMTSLECVQLFDEIEEFLNAYYPRNIYEPRWRTIVTVDMECQRIKTAAGILFTWTRHNGSFNFHSTKL